VSPSFEERQEIIENFVETGSKSSQKTFYITADPGSVKVFPSKYPEDMYLFVCNPRADLMIKDLINAYKMKGVDNLTDIDIALAKAFRQLDMSQTAPKRACIEIVSDVLLQHHAVITRKWLSGLIQELKSKRFTILGVIDPLISPDEVHAISSLFDGEIRITEKESDKGKRKVLQIVKLYNQRYLENELVLTKEKLSS